MNKPTYQQLLAHDYPLSLGMNGNDEEPFDGGCPCCLIHGEDFEVDVSCWREHGGYSEIKVSGSLPRETLIDIAWHIRDNNGWTDHTNWEIVIE